MINARHVLLIIAVAGNAVAGEIPGVPSQLPPFVDVDIEFNLSNDFLGRGGRTDDFRTQQFVLTARFTDRWFAVVDHSVLTLDRVEPESRADQISASLGYTLVDDAHSRLLAGIGFRRSGQFGGERLQNGFHRLVGSTTIDLPYTVDKQTDATLWIAADHYRPIAPSANSSRSWEYGVWLRGTALATSDSQFDAAAAVFAVATHNVVSGWFGIRQDWREGYDAAVFSQTANEEADTAVVVGLRLGPLVAETTQQLNNGSSFGQLRFISSGRSDPTLGVEAPRFALEAGTVMPDVHVSLAGKMRTTLFADGDASWREYTFADIRYGEPQYDNEPEQFLRVLQFAMGMEWERPLGHVNDWVSFYSSIGAGWRREQLLGDLQLSGIRSESVNRGVAIGGAGLRFFGSSLGGHWSTRLQLGLTGWLPFGDASVDFDGSPVTIQRPGWGASVAVTFDYR